MQLGQTRHNFELGQHGRSRTNVWEYAGVNSFKRGRMQELESHPTVKPVAMITDAIRDCSRRGDLILDPFCGSGTVFLAAERSGRRARAIEIGVDDYLGKPYQEAQLLEAIEPLIARRREAHLREAN